jgi:hypothetical protein
MYGIPYKIARPSDTGTNPVETIYLRTIRMGEQGAKFQELIRTIDRRSMEVAVKQSELQKLIARIDAMGPETPEVEIGAAQSSLAGQLDGLIETKEDIADMSEEVILLSLALNYGDDAAKVADKLSDRDISGMILALKQGEQPQDFFPRPVTLPSETSTLPSGGCSIRPSPSTGLTPTGLTPAT